MFFKKILAFIFSAMVGFGAVNTKVYEAPPVDIKNVATSTISSEIKVKKETTPSPTPTIETTPTPTKILTKKPTPVVTPSIKTTPTPTPTEQSTVFLPQIDFEKVNTAARVAIVNIICTANGNSLSPISGTGVMISQKGIVITNAHIGQYLLLKDLNGKDYVQCIIRTGNPAYPTYNTELMFISPTWVSDNASVITDQDPKGTGENDFAFLHITGRIDGGNLPTEGFPYLIPDVREFIKIDEPVLLISYPAGFLGTQLILRDLNMTSSITNIKNVYTFKKDTIDLLDVGGTIVSQKGSSGGAVIDSFVSLLGMITTSSEENTTDKRELRAITMSHINRTMQSELGMNLDTFLSQNPTEFGKKFWENIAPALTKILNDQLSR